MNKYIGKVLDGRYEIIEVIGIGGMSVVYKAMDNRLNRYVALKMLKEEYSTDEALKKQFHDESQSVAILSHPNIVSVFDVSHYEDSEYIVMELIEGITLKEYLQRRGILSWKEVTFFSIQIAKALEHAHSRNIIHRDIKPQNIMLLRDGTLKVADFGIARNMSNQGTKGIGEAIGSVHYVSPEQAKGSHIDSRSDLYSFGIVMYEMLTGRLPFEGDTPVSIAIQHINSMALPPSTFVSNIPKTLENITMKAMNPSLSKRYSSASEILHDLECFRNDPHFVIVNKHNPEDIKISESVEKNEHKDTSKGSLITETNKKDSRTVSEKENKKNTDPSAGRTMTDQKNEDKSKRSKKQKKEEKKKEKEKEESQEEEDKGTGFSGAVIFAVLAILICLGGAAFFLIKVLNPFGSTESKKVLVPYLVGLDYETVINSYEYYEYNIQPGEYLYNETYEEGKIIEQNPSANKSIEKGEEIIVNISRGPKEFKIADYSGRQFQEVQSELEHKGVTVYKKEEYSDKYSAGIVISTDPAYGNTVARGGSVTVICSSGPKPAETTVVPDLRGKTISEAIAAIEGASLQLDKTYTVDSTEEKGKVIYQTISPFSTVEKGSKITIHLSAGPQEPAIAAGSGISFDPYPNAAGKRKIDFSFNIEDTEGAIEITVKVNGILEYQGTHYRTDGTITVPLTANEGSNTVTVTQNEKTTFNESVAF